MAFLRGELVIPCRLAKARAKGWEAMQHIDDRMISGDTPFCFLAIPMMILPAAFTKTVIFPGCNNSPPYFAAGSSDGAGSPRRWQAMAWAR